MSDFLACIQEEPQYVQAVKQLLDRVSRRARRAQQEERVAKPFEELYKTDKKTYLQRYL